MGGVAVIGWGSLIWDLDNLAPHVTGGWALGAGPALPIEFSRVSAKRLGALTLVVDPEHGAAVRTAVIRSARDAAAAAAADLAARERAPPERIGFVCAATGQARCSHGLGAETVGAWCRAEGWNGAVWTDLPANFEAETGRAFSVAAGIAHLKGLTGPSLAEAKRYVDGAPPETQTPLRQALAVDPWWTGLTAER